MARFRVERWGTRRVISVRNQKGQILSWHRWSPKFKLSQARERFYEKDEFGTQRGSLSDDGIYRDVLSEKLGTVQITNTNITIKNGVVAKKPKIEAPAFMYQFAILLRDKTRLHANSLQRPSDWDIGELREEALENLKMRIAQYLGFAYDDTDREEVTETYQRQLRAGKVREGVVYYKGRNVARTVHTV
jgi:hypothetical protein